MTHTIQHLSLATIGNTEKTRKTEAEEVADDILAVCDSLNKLCHVLSRLEYAIKRKNIEIGLAQKRQDNSAEKI